MKKLIPILFITAIPCMTNAQVKIGHNAATPVSNAAVLELSNDTSAGTPANSWKALILPYVNFNSTTSFASSATWGISGTATEGAMVYNTGNRTTNGFQGIGAYVWSNGSWRAVAPATTCGDPGPAPGSTGCISFTYNGSQVTYTTVRAADGNIWLQQNLGASGVATSATDASAYGHLFQWGRWDDGHQLTTSPAVFASTLTANNPSGLGAGSASFYKGNNPNDWWGNGSGTDTWSGSAASATNGIDPCTVLGSGWHLPSVTQWGTLITMENITNISSAFSSNLKLPAPGMREPIQGNLLNQGSAGQYWANTASGPYAKDVTIMSTSINPSDDAYRSYGFSVRCMKN